MSLKTLMGWQSLRTLALMLMFCSASVILVKLLLDNRPVKDRIYTPPAFTFPEQVPLPGWQFERSASVPLPDNKAFKKRLIASQSYTYKQGNLPLKIDMRYTKDTSGNIRIERYRKGIGYYVLLSDPKGVYLTSCINPRGESTVTLPQFQRNRYYNDISLDRLTYWLFNPSTLRDFRCLWVHAAVPADALSLSTAYSTLESAWFSWKPWWQEHFPRP
jgi:cyanosortase A-associated protein